MGKKHRQIALALLSFITTQIFLVPFPFHVLCMFLPHIESHCTSSLISFATLCYWAHFKILFIFKFPEIPVKSLTAKPIFQAYMMERQKILGVVKAFLHRKEIL